MANFIDKGLVKADDPMFSEGIKVISVRKAKDAGPVSEEAGKKNEEKGQGLSKSGRERPEKE